MPETDPQFRENLIQKTLLSAKYRSLELPRDLLEDILMQEAKFARNKAALEKRFREKLHQIVAPYLEEMDCTAEITNLRVFSAANPSQSEWKAYSLEIMAKHASSRERLPNIQEFASALNPYVAKAQKVLDLAAGLDPLMLPWLDLSAKPVFEAYDLQKPRVDYLNAFFTAFYSPGRAFLQDILANPPQEKADLAFFFKEAHRFEKRLPGSNRQFFQNLPAQILLVSLPAKDLAGRHSLADYHRRILHEATTGLPWSVSETQIREELLFCIDKGEIA
ncbi:MAG: hypothetical protein VB108_06215 [Anaerolineaceae bacterium]|nr:hypothetical protein [Anaerolineaceae bacterium]